MTTAKLQDLKSLVKEIIINTKRAGLDLEAVPWQTKASMQNMKADAIQLLATAKASYSRRVRSNSIGLFVFGDADRVAKFCKISSDVAGVLQVDGGYIYNRLAIRIEPTLGGSREFGPTQLQGLIEGLRDINQEIGVRTMRMPGLKNISVSANRSELLVYIRDLVRSSVDDDLLRMFIDQSINNAAIDAQFEGPGPLAVAVTNLVDRTEVQPLASLFTNSITVEVGTSEDGEVDEEYVLNRLKSFKSKLKAKTNQ